jgi:CxxC motif-containing protein (DUF1111 family)
MRPLPTFGLLLALAGTAQAEAPLQVSAEDASRQAFSLPMAGLDADESAAFLRGRSLFRQVWVIAPSRDETVDGLGPLYNRPACTSCHPANGRGQAPEQPGQRMASMLVRLSLPGSDAQGGPLPHPAYGDQLNESGVPGVAGEGRASLIWTQMPFRFADGESVTLRRPRIAFGELAYGSLDGVLTSARVGPPVFGLGLLDAVDDATIEALAARPLADGVQGRVNWVWSPQAGAQQVGRFGLKANVARLREQIAGALHGDMGITSTLHPRENCMAAQSACAQTPNGGQPELSDAQLDDIEAYLRYLAVPTRRDPDSPVVRQGEAQFQALGCAACHRPQMVTGQRASDPRLRGVSFAPYSDLLLHDMGEGLADGRPDYQANGQDWRTAPLWGIGLAQRLSLSAGFLHDGRARSPSEAILWHGGEAQAARERFVALPRQAREALLVFLGSL